MTRSIPAVLAAAALLALTASTQAQSERNQKLLGTWTRHAEDCKVKLELKPETLRCTITTEDGFAIAIDADYVVSKDGVLLGIVHAPKSVKVAKKDKDGDDPLNKRLFYFQVSADDKALVIDNLNIGAGGDDDKMRDVLEGKYHKAEAKAHKTVGTGSTLPSTHYLQQAPAYCPPQSQASPTKPTQGSNTDNPERRFSELLKQSEDFRNIEKEWERIWIFDQPSHLTPERVHGGIQ